MHIYSSARSNRRSQASSSLGHASSPHHRSQPRALQPTLKYHLIFTHWRGGHTAPGQVWAGQGRSWSEFLNIVTYQWIITVTLLLQSEWNWYVHLYTKYMVRQYMFPVQHYMRADSLAPLASSERKHHSWGDSSTNVTSKSSYCSWEILMHRCLVLLCYLQMYNAK